MYFYVFCVLFRVHNVSPFYTSLGLSLVRLPLPLMVSHDAEMAAYADRVLTLRDGAIIADSKKGKNTDETE